VRIAIDASSVPPLPAGAGVYAIELVRAMAERDRHDGYALFARGAWADDVTAGRKNWRWECVGARSRPARLTWEQLRLPSRVARLDIDVLHSTHHTLPLRPMQAARVVTIHDLTFFRIPARYPLVRRIYFQTLTRLSARVAEAVIVPSETVASDAARILMLDPAKVHVVYEAAGARYAPVAPDAARAVARRHGVEPPYVLSVGSLEPGKNRSRLIRAMARLRAEGFPHRLVIIGQPAWKHEAEQRLPEELGIEDGVHVLGYVAGEDLPALYCAADVCALPSLYEGFGLPVLEAMACGTPVLTSDVSATAEVAGDAAVLVDPLSVDAITDGLRRLLRDGGLRSELARRGRERAGEFSWKRAADETHAVYRHAAAARAGER
jgi:glycosyltransferase involved in cell wall biosynthesis